MYPYLIFTYPYDSKCGGNIALHRLGHELVLKSVPVFTNTPRSGQHPEWPIPYAPVQSSAQFAKYGAIAIYPEVTHGNPFGCSTVVRWILYSAGFFGGPASYPPKDLIYPYSEIYNEWKLPPERILHVPFIDTDIYFDPGCSNRSGVCFYVGKDFGTPRIPETSGSLEITKTFPDDPRDLAKIFQTSELFICYDNATALVDNARLCGCPVIVVPGRFSRDQLKYDLGWNGIGWGMEELKAAKELDSSTIRVNYQRLLERSRSQIDLFIRQTQRVAENNSSV